MGDTLLLVASDRISAFDVILQPGVPDKGKILTQLSNFWFAKFSDVENHLLETEVERFPEELRAAADQIAGRSVLVRKTEVIPFECVARGYVAGSGWAEYRKTGEVCGIRLPPGLVRSRAPAGAHLHAGHEERDGDTTRTSPSRIWPNALGTEEAGWLKTTTLSLYGRARDYAESRGLLLADTKLEFGRLEEGRLLWIDEAFTPDSSRYWDSAALPAGPEPRSPTTSSSCGTGSNRPAGTRGLPRLACRKESFARPGRSTSRASAS